MESSPSRRAPFAALLFLACLTGCGSGGELEGERPRSALLLTLDTTRADALSCYGGPPGLTPHLDALADDGRLFLDAHTTAPMTLPSHASMLTGLWPPRHTMRTNGSMVLPPAAVTLAEKASENGFETAAFLAAVVLDPRFGLNQGFEVYRPPFENPDLSTLEASRPGSAVMDETIAWLEGRDNQRPFLLWVHLFDPHNPYAPPPEFQEPGRHPYHGEVARMDADVGRLFDALKAHGLWDDLLVVAVGDHGEGLEDHGEKTHSALAFETTMRVPLILRDPYDDARRGVRSREPVSVVDVFPTLVQALGLGAPGDVDGRNLFRSEVEPERGVYFETCFGQYSFGWSPVLGWLAEGEKYLHSSAPELYDLTDDPGETKNLVNERSRRALEYRAEIARVLEQPALPAVAMGSDPELMKQLEKLGYAGAGTGGLLEVDPLAPGDLPSPVARIDAYRRYEEAQARIVKRDFAGALVLLDGIARENPYNHAALIAIGGLHVQLGQPAKAIEPLERSLELAGENASVFWNLGLAYDQLGDHEAAHRNLASALLLDPRREKTLRATVRSLESRGATADAARYRRVLEESGS